LNHAPGDAINPLRPVDADANTLILLPLSGAQPTWRDLLLASSRSKMTLSGHWALAARASIQNNSGPKDLPGSPQQADGEVD
jgi:hypothetical protein